MSVKEFEGPPDSSFDGSHGEHCIFREIFFRNNSGKSIEDRVLSGVDGCKCEKRELKDVPFCSNSERSSLTREDDSGSLRDRMESQPGPFSGQTLSSLVPPGAVVSGTSDEATHSATSRLVESSNEGVTSSFYMLKRDLSLETQPEFSDRDVLKQKFSLDGMGQKEVVISKAIASPISQESHATKLLVVSPPVTVTNNSGKPRTGKPKWKDSCFIELEESELSLPKDIKNDPRPLLRCHINRLFKAAGWLVGRRKRNTNTNNNIVGEYVYKSPEGRPFRQFYRAWCLCGESLLVYINNVVQENEYKEWSNTNEFWTDLSGTVSEIELQLNSSVSAATLARGWYLLDPFAAVVFIDKTYSLFKDGKPVRAQRTLIVAPYANCDRNDSSPSCFAPSGYHVTGGQRGNCLFEVPVSSRRGHSSSVGSDIVSPRQDSNTSSPSFDKDTNHLEGMPVTAAKDVSMGCAEEEGKTSGQIVRNQVGVILRRSILGDVNCKSDGSMSKKALKSKIGCTSSGAKTAFKRKGHKKRKRISEIRQNSKLGVPMSHSSGLQDNGNQSDLRIEECFPHESGSKKYKSCALKDDDLLISAIIKNKSFKSSSKKAVSKSKPMKKRKGQKGGCRLLLRSLNKGGKHSMEEKWTAFSLRTVLSWLIYSGVLSLNEVIQYRNLKDDSVVKDGLVTRDGILCRCCNKVLSISQFKSHAGFKSNRPCMNLFMESGKPFTFSQLEAWSAEYKARKGVHGSVQDDEMDKNDDSCGRCGDVGELICCDNCPSTFHQACLYAQELPEGNWYCPHCSCRICGDVVNDTDNTSSRTAFKCVQCEQKYHGACLKEKVIESSGAIDIWFCNKGCQEVYSGLQVRLGTMNFLSDGLSWSLLRCSPGDQKVHSAQKTFALMAECNSKLAVAITIMEECFLPMVDPRTGVDMIPHVIYNRGSQFARLNYHGFYTAVLEENDILTCVASIRIHGVRVAEVPLIATCSRYRRKGMCRRLMTSIEEMLKSLKVETLVISAIPGLVETWTVGFGFEPLEENEKRSLSSINLMVFPGTVWLKKSLCGSSNENGLMETADSTGAEDCVEGSQAGGIITEPGHEADQMLPDGKAVGEKESESNEDSENPLPKVDQGETGPNSQSAKLSCKEPTGLSKGSNVETVCTVV